MLRSIGATLYVTMVTCHHHFWKWWWLSLPLLGKRIVFALLPEAFCGLKYSENAIAAGAPPRIPLGELTSSPDPMVGWGADTVPHTPPDSAQLAPRCSRLRRFDRLPSWHQILAMPGKVAPVLRCNSKQSRNPCSQSWKRKEGYGGEDLQKRKVLSLESRSDGVMEY